MPNYIIKALEELFGESAGRVRVIENSFYAALHGKIWATTRKELILLNMNIEDFLRRPELMLHEYHHVIRQWRSGDLTAFRYLLESAKNGYTNNKYEIETNQFVQQNIDLFKQLLNKYQTSEKTQC